ncbi:MAG: helicase, partial [Bradyrhizobium sp.]|nr:helicase [Bradyrhizobium sp.]
TPLAVARQIEKEAHRFGYDARVIRSQDDAAHGINICNYDRLDHIDPDFFGVVSLDESSILKNFTGATTRRLISAFAAHRFRLCSTATPAPNDHMELGTHAEFLGVMNSNEMLSRWFKNDTSSASQVWRLKGHAVNDFWDWVASWSRCAGSPADLGFDGSRHVLPPLNLIRHKVDAEDVAADGMLFSADVSATTMHAVKRKTASARAKIVADLVSEDANEPWVLWCDSDAEADALLSAIPDAGEVRGSHSPDKKESTLAAFADGSVRYLIAKPSSCGFGLNWQHAAKVAFIGRSFSYESWFQAVRRCWRFGQTRQVDVHLIVAEGEDQIGRVISRKSAGHETMKRAMAESMKRSRAAVAQNKVPYHPNHQARLPSWL